MPPLGMFQLQSKLASVTGLPQDTCENVIHVAIPDGTYAGGDPLALMEAFRDFYNEVPTGGALAVGARISESISRAAGACSITIYSTDDLSGVSGFGSPIASLNFTLTAAQVGSGLPEEVAIIASYHGDLTDVPVSVIVDPGPPVVTIRPQQRRRGRLYLGPLQAAAGTEASLQFRPNQQIQDELGEAMVDLAAAIVAVDPTFYLGVWSKADEDVWEVVGGYVDDAWDTQRRRGLEATERTAFTI